MLRRYGHDVTRRRRTEDEGARERARLALRRVPRAADGRVYIANEWFASNWSVKSTRPVIRARARCIPLLFGTTGPAVSARGGPTLTRCATRTDPQWNDLLRNQSFLPRNCERWLMWERSPAIYFVSCIDSRASERANYRARRMWDRPASSGLLYTNLGSR